MVYRLPDDCIVFPDPHEGEPDGMIAVGGDLSLPRLELAYNNGIFPWFSFRDWDEPVWYCPLERFVIFPSEVHVSHSMKSLINKEQYRVSINEDFSGVINGCRTVDDRYNMPGAWLGPEIVKAYTMLHNLGMAASVEVWDGDTLVGGLYGVTVNGVFIGESMFSRVPSASKLALIGLARHLEYLGWKMIDCQIETPHLKSMGGRYISYEEYMEILRR